MNRLKRREIEAGLEEWEKIVKERECLFGNQAERVILTQHHLKEILQYSFPAVSRMLRAGKLKHYKRKKKIYILARDLKEELLFLQSGLRGKAT